MQVVFYNLQKEINSTETPSGGSSYDLDLLDECSILNPSLIIKSVSSNVLKTWNYAYIADFGRYYFIDLVTILNKNESRIDLSVDPMASYKTDIGNYDKCQLARCSDSSKYNINIVDSMCVSTAGLKTSKTLTATWGQGGNFTPATPSVTATIFGEDGTLIINSKDSLTAFIGGIFWDIDWWNNFVVGGQSPQQYVKDVIMLPLQFSGYAPINDKCCGKLEMDISNGKNISQASDRCLTRSFTIDLNGYSEYNDFRDYNSNFVKATLQAPFIGNIDIDPKLLRYSSINGTYEIDMGTGDTRFSLSANKTVDQDNYHIPIMVTSVNVGALVAFTAETINANLPVQVIQDAVGIAGAGLPSSQTVANPLNVVGNVANNAFNLATDVASMNAGGMFTYTSSGGNGNLSAWEDMSCNLYVNINGSSNREGYKDTNGWPCLKNAVKINTITSGSFVQLVNPSFKCNNATNTEISIINSYLANGFYWVN